MKNKLKKNTFRELKKITLLLLILLISITLTGCIFKKQSTKTEISIEEQKLVTDYMKENISELSPEKEILGGKFYITDVYFKNLKNAVVSYEDGHVSMTANVEFKINNKEVEIISFELVKNGAVISSTHIKCNAHEDCIPLPKCHARDCINKKFKNQYTKPDVCTEIFDFCAAYKPEDCICQQGTCFNQNLMNQECK